MFLDVSRGFPALTDDLRKICEGKIGYSECFNVLGTFPKNKTPGNDGLTTEFYLAFWPLFGRLLVDSLNYTSEFGELSNSQKQAIIPLVEKKGKDKRMIKNISKTFGKGFTRNNTLKSKCVCQRKIYF